MMFKWSTSVSSLTVRQDQVQDIFGYKETDCTIIHCPVKMQKQNILLYMCSIHVLYSLMINLK